MRQSGAAGQDGGYARRVIPPGLASCAAPFAGREREPAVPEHCALEARKGAG